MKENWFRFTRSQRAVIIHLICFKKDHYKEVLAMENYFCIKNPSNCLQRTRHYNTEQAV